MGRCCLVVCLLRTRCEGNTMCHWDVFYVNIICINKSVFDAGLPRGVSRVSSTDQHLEKQCTMCSTGASLFPLAAVWSGRSCLRHTTSWACALGVSCIRQVVTQIGAGFVTYQGGGHLNFVTVIVVTGHSFINVLQFVCKYVRQG